MKKIDWELLSIKILFGFVYLLFFVGIVGLLTIIIMGSMKLIFQ